MKLKRKRFVRRLACRLIGHHYHMTTCHRCLNVVNIEVPPQLLKPSPPPTVSQETIAKRTKIALDKYAPMIVESVRITRELNEHANLHEFGAVADCQSCQEEKAQEESRRGKA